MDPAFKIVPENLRGDLRTAIQFLQGERELSIKMLHAIAQLLRRIPCKAPDEGNLPIAFLTLAVIYLLSFKHKQTTRRHRNLLVTSVKWLEKLTSYSLLSTLAGLISALNRRNRNILVCELPSQSHLYSDSALKCSRSDLERRECSSIYSQIEWNGSFRKWLTSREPWNGVCVRGGSNGDGWSFSEHSTQYVAFLPSCCPLYPVLTYSRWHVSNLFEATPSSMAFERTILPWHDDASCSWYFQREHIWLYDQP